MVMETMIHGKILSIILLILVLTSLNSILIAYSSQITEVSKNWNKALSHRLMWLLNNVVGLDVSKYLIDNIRIEDVGLNSTYYIVQLRRNNNLTVEVPVIVDSNGEIIEFALRGIVPDRDLLKTYRLELLKRISSQPSINNIEISDMETLSDIIINIVKILSGNSTILKALENKIGIPSTPVELKRIDPFTYKAEIDAGNNIYVELTIHSETDVTVITIYYTFDIYDGVVYKHNVLEILTRTIPSNDTIYFINGVKYEPYNISIYMKNKLSKPEKYIPRITKYVKTYLSSQYPKGCEVRKVKFYDVYGKPIKLVNNTKIIHLYYSYIVETNKYNYIVYLDPINGTILKIEPYGSYEDYNGNHNGSNDTDTISIVLIITATTIAIIGIIAILYKRRLF